MLQALALAQNLWKNRGNILPFIAIAIFLGVAGYVVWLRHDLSKTKIELTSAKAERDKAQQDLIDFQDVANKAINDLTVLKNDQITRIKQARVREREIRNVPKDQDGPVAPVLFDSLIRMRNDQ